MCPDAWVSVGLRCSHLTAKISHRSGAQVSWFYRVTHLKMKHRLMVLTSQLPSLLAERLYHKEHREGTKTWGLRVPLRGNLCIYGSPGSIRSMMRAKKIEREEERGEREGERILSLTPDLR